MQYAIGTLAPGIGDLFRQAVRGDGVADDGVPIARDNTVGKAALAEHRFGQPPDTVAEQLRAIATLVQGILLISGLSGHHGSW